MLSRQESQSADRTIAEHVNQALLNRGFRRAPCHIMVFVQSGAVTLTGDIESEQQRHAILQLVRGVNGVRSAADRLQLIPAPAAHKTQAR